MRLEHAADARLAMEAAIYNCLPSVGQANSVVRTWGHLDKMLAVVGPLLAGSELCHSWGAHLLHRHWPLDDGTVPAEEPVRWVSNETEMHPVRNDLAGFVPITYLVTSGGYRAIEFSRTPYAIRAHQLLTARPHRHLLQEVLRAMVGTGLCQHFGLSIVRENYDDDRRWAETSIAHERRSRLQCLAVDKLTGKQLVQTSWSFNERDSHRRCGSCVVEDATHDKAA